MEMCFIRPGEKRNFLIHWSCSTFLKILKSIRRCPPSKKNIIIAGSCFIYLFFVVSQVGHVVHRDRLSDKDKYRGKGINTSGLKDFSRSTTGSSTAQNADTVPPKYNVIYITLKSKRHKPAIIRGTVRPKSRRKIIRKYKDLERNVKSDWKMIPINQSVKVRIQGRHVYHKLKTSQRDLNAGVYRHSSIRIYSERAPPWFSKEDIEALRFLADCEITKIKDFTPNEHSRLLLFESEKEVSLKFPSKTNGGHVNSLCQGRCGLIKRPVDMSEVFAFHLDRILGLNRSMPVVCRKFNFFQDGQPSPVALWDPSLSLAENELQSSVKLTWGYYQRSLKLKCWHRGSTPSDESGCTSIRHYEWSKLALFDFLLQIYNRLDRNCCGFKPRKEDICMELGRHLECTDQDSVHLVHIVHRKHDPRHLVLIDNKGYFDRDEENLDFKLLEGIQEFPEQAVRVLQSNKLREKLIQSLFLDQVYWESQGGRQGIEKLIDVIERRAKILLTYINAHGIKLTPMNM